MLRSSCAWRRFGRPPGLYTDQELADGIHAGDIETSLMLHFRPDLVRMEKVENFVPSTIGSRRSSSFCARPAARAFGWIAQDLHPAGAAGDASLGDRREGPASRRSFRPSAFIKLLRDVTRFKLEQAGVERVRLP